MPKKKHAKKEAKNWIKAGNSSNAKNSSNACKIDSGKSTLEIQEWYNEHLADKDKEIDRLKRENAILLSTALKQGARAREILERTEKEMKKKRIID